MSDYFYLKTAGYIGVILKKYTNYQLPLYVTIFYNVRNKVLNNSMFQPMRIKCAIKNMCNVPCPN